MKMHHNLNELQWQLKSKYLHICDPKSCLDVLKTPFKKFFDSKKVKASDFNNKSWQKHFKNYTRHEPETYRQNLLCEIQAIKEIEKWLKEKETQQQESLVTEGIAIEDNLSTDDTTLDATLIIEALDNVVAKESTVDSSTSSKQQNEYNSLVEQKDTIFCVLIQKNNTCNNCNCKQEARKK
ncbi:hypothetical protein Tco_1361291 [Tanacetum coccineum]